MTVLRPSPFFIADHVGLDFLNSIAAPGGTVVEWLGSGEDLLAWLGLAKLVPDAVLGELRDRAHPGELDAAAAQARALRDWFRLFAQGHMGASLPLAALPELAPLNQLLSRDREFGQVVASEERPEETHAGQEGALPIRFAWQRQRHWLTPEALLFPLGQALADLICNEDFADVKDCEAPDCMLMFVDRTRNHTRRWCSMTACGNRAKQAAHRERAQRRGRPKAGPARGRR